VIDDEFVVQPASSADRVTVEVLATHMRSGSLLVSLDRPERHTAGSTRELTRACLEFPRFRGHVRVSQAWWIRADTGLSKTFLVTLWALATNVLEQPACRFVGTPWAIARSTSSASAFGNAVFRRSVERRASCPLSTHR
jgi:hypothetical protein